MMVECFVEVYRRGLDISANKIKVMVLGGEERSVVGTRLEHVS